MKDRKFDDIFKVYRSEAINTKMSVTRDFEVTCFHSHIIWEKPSHILKLKQVTIYSQWNELLYYNSEVKETILNILLKLRESI